MPELAPANRLQLELISLEEGVKTDNKGYYKKV